jgi:hypothetical protein
MSGVDDCENVPSNPDIVLRWLRSQRAYRSSDHRDDFDLGIAVLRLTPRALDCNDHLLGRIDEDELAKDASRRVPAPS